MASFRLSSAIRKEIIALYYEFLFGEALRKADKALSKQLYRLYDQLTDKELHNLISSNRTLANLDVFSNHPAFVRLRSLSMHRLNELKIDMGIQSPRLVYAVPDVPSFVFNTGSYTRPLSRAQRDLRVNIAAYGPRFAYAPRNIKDVTAYWIHTPSIEPTVDIDDKLFYTTVIEDTNIEPEVKRLVILLAFYTTLLTEQILPKIADTKNAIEDDLERCTSTSQVVTIRPDLAAIMALLQENHNLTPSAIRSHMRSLKDGGMNWGLKLSQDLKEELMRHRLTLDIDDLIEAL